MKTIQGNLLQLAEAGEFDVIVQGCNCFCTMGSGLAKTIHDQYPQAYFADLETTRGDVKKLGTYTSADAESFIIVNAYTQFEYNSIRDKKDVFKYEAFKSVLEKLAKDFAGFRIGFPLIGCGLAGGDKDKVVAMLEEFSNTVAVDGGSATLVEYK